MRGSGECARDVDEEEREEEEREDVLLRLDDIVAARYLGLCGWPCCVLALLRRQNATLTWE